jgi:ribosome recycling factor
MRVIALSTVIHPETREILIQAWEVYTLEYVENIVKHVGMDNLPCCLVWD